MQQGWHCLSATNPLESVRRNTLGTCVNAGSKRTVCCCWSFMWDPPVRHNQVNNRGNICDGRCHPLQFSASEIQIIIRVILAEFNLSLSHHRGNRQSIEDGGFLTFVLQHWVLGSCISSYFLVAQGSVYHRVLKQTAGTIHYSFPPQTYK